MEMISGTGLGGHPWPELMPDRRPVLVVPAAPGRLLVLEDGWADRDTATPELTAGPDPAWSAVLDDHRLTIHRPGGLTWFDGDIAATREWRRQVREHRTLLLITGPFTSVFDFRTTAAAGQLFLLTTPIRLASGI
ncbi:hypothetical protein [Kitasatospora sp. MBT66]|uniref:hypothetical protein n=1 Tax=Kitasatospora sp. MBT66 TaxID=1444769 RepID=UPI0005BA049F|nr:hypothetical protein [Kitasatospora sp. MBT66]